MTKEVYLWVDDIRPPPNDEWVWVQTVEQAKTILAQDVVIKASFDHDLGLGEDGSALVRWLAEFGHWPHERPRCHSANTVGRTYIEGVIERYGPY